MSQIPPLSEWIPAAGLRDDGSGEWRSKCHLCGEGNNRFWVREEDGKTIIGSRCDCMRGLKGKPKMKKIFEIMRICGLEKYTGDDSERVGVGRNNRERIEKANDIWNSARSVIGTPAEVYLREVRRVWPSRMAYPDSVRWWPASALDAERNPLAAGAIIWKYETTPHANPLVKQGEVAAVSYEVLMSNGELPIAVIDDEIVPNRHRRTRGVKSASRCLFGVEGGSPLIITEGELGGMSAVWVDEILNGNSQAEIWSAGGYTFYKDLARLIRKGREVQIWNDCDSVGEQAAQEFAASLRLHGGCDVKVVPMHTGEPKSDADDLLQQLIREGKAQSFLS